MLEQNKQNLLLDLDQTLISAEPSEEYDFKKNEEKAKKFTYHDMLGYYVIFERPGVQEFLEKSKTLLELIHEVEDMWKIHH